MKRFPLPPSSPTQAGGFILVTSLVFLVVITLLAVSAINSSSLQERMASNLREKSRAQQAADAALRFAQDGIESDFFKDYRKPGYCYALPDGGTCDNSEEELRIWPEDGMFSGVKPANGHAFLEQNIWKAAKVQSIEIDPAMPPVAFFVEEVPSKFQCNTVRPNPSATGCKVIYRITARAQGENPGVVAVTQAIYQKSY